MQWLAQLLRQARFRLVSVMQRRRVESDLNEELRFHVEEAVAEKVAEGLSEAEARRQAHLELGGIEQLKESYRDQRGLPLLEQLWQDLTRSVRTLLRSRTFSIGAISILALGAAAMATVKIGYDGIVGSNPPYLGDPERAVAIFVSREDRPTRERHVSVPDFTEWSAALRSFDSVVAYATAGGPVSTGERHDFTSGVGVSEGFFELLGVQATIGRTFSTEEHAASFPAVIVISHGFWQERYGGDPDVVGKQAVFYRSPMTIVGVMPPGFDFPTGIDYWAPLQQSIVPLHDRTQQRLALMGRLKPHVPIETASTEVAALVASQQAELGESSARRTARVIPLRDRFNLAHSGEWRLFLFAAVAVQVLAALNVAGLLLARSLARAPERALKASLGASRGRLFREALIESAVLALSGALLGLAITAAIQPLLLTAVGANLRFPTWWRFGMDLRTVGSTCLLTLAFVVLCVALPAWRSAQVSLDDRLRTLNASRGAARWSAKFRAVAIWLQLVIAVGLTMCAIRATENVYQLQHQPLGVDTDHVGWIGVTVVEVQGRDVEEAEAYFNRLEDEVARVPGVIAVGIANTMPGIDARTVSVTIESPSASKQLEGISRRLVTAGALRAFRMQLMQGRELSRDDARSATPGIIVDTTFARRAFGAEDPIGRTILIEDPRTKETKRPRIIGVVQASRNTLFQDPVPTIYEPYSAASSYNSGAVFFRTHGDPAQLLDHITAIARRLGDRISILPRFDGRYTTFIELSYWEERLMSRMMLSFAMLAVGLSLAGIFASVTFAVTERRREIGIKLALGATPQRVTTEFCVWGLRLALAAAVVGTVIAVFATPWYLVQLRRTFPLTPWLYVSTFGLALLGVVIACWIPARRASRADPMDALRCD